jgi:hypothetical protein
MSKSETQLSEANSKLADALDWTKSHQSFFKGDASDSPPSNEPLPSLAGETQQIGNLVFPRFAWTAAWTPNRTTLLIKLGGDLIEVCVRGKWDSPPPPNSDPRNLPAQHPSESGPTYFFRALRHYQEPNRRNPEYRDWLNRRTWEGESSNDLLAALRAGQNLPDRAWAFVTEKQQPSTPSYCE